MAASTAERRVRRAEAELYKAENALLVERVNDRYPHIHVGERVQAAAQRLEKARRQLQKAWDAMGR